MIFEKFRYSQHAFKTSLYPLYKSSFLLNMPKNIRPEWRFGIIETLRAVVQRGMTPLDPLADSTFDDRENMIDRAAFLSKSKKEQGQIRKSIKKNLKAIADLLRETNDTDSHDIDHSYHMDRNKINHDNMLMAQQYLAKLGLKYEGNS